MKLTEIVFLNDVIQKHRATGAKMQMIMVCSAQGAAGMANSVDPDQTAPFRSSLIRANAVCSALSLPVLVIFMIQ